MKTYIDTNVFVRFFINDVKNQAKIAKNFFDAVESESAVGIVSLLVLQEVLWIMGDFYKIKRNVFVEQFVQILALKNIKLREIDKQSLFGILDIYKKTSLDLTDIYLVDRAKQDKGTVLSFDKDIKKLLLN